MQVNVMSYSNAISIHHYLLTLLLLDNSSYGRYTLSNLLGLSKSKTRQILERFIKHDLAVSSPGRGGTKLTLKGKSIAVEIKRYVYVDLNKEIIKIDDPFINSQKFVSMGLINTINTNTKGLYERDLAVRENADGAITLIKNANNWVIPPDNTAFNIEIENHLLRHKYNMVIVCFGTSLNYTLNGLAKIIVYHLEDEIFNLVSEYIY